jgi:type IV pilus assembly protein PilC
MPTFIYKAKDASGRTIREQAIAKDSSDLLFDLRAKKLTVISVEEVKNKAAFARSRGKGVKLKLLSQFSRQLATMVGAGIPLVRDLRILSGQIEDKDLRAIANSLCQHIEAGSSLSEALSHYPAVFSPLYINMVSAGEASGALSEILERLAVHLEKSDALRRRTVSALVYPLAIVVVGLLISAFLVLVVIPRFKEIFSLMGAQLPLLTRIFLSISDNARKYFLYFLAIMIFGGWSLMRYINSPGGSLKFDYFKLKVPILGTLFQKFAIARFSSTLSTLLKSGVPILNSLDIVAKTVGNKVIELTVKRIREQVSQGQRMATQLAEEKVFPQMVSEMVGVGEESGELEKMLGKIADAYEQEVEATINGLLSLLEPFIIIFLGLVVGSVVLAMFLPILKITQVLGVG